MTMQTNPTSSNTLINYKLTKVMKKSLKGVESLKRNNLLEGCDSLFNNTSH